MTDDLDTLFDHAGIKSSPVRILILKTLSEATAPLSALEIEHHLLTVDRSSITRTLALFTEKSVVHPIEDGSGAVKYELCRCHHTDRHDDLHPHFYCISCRRTYCLTTLSIPSVTLPPGFRPSAANYVIKGICPDCASPDTLL